MRVVKYKGNYITKDIVKSCFEEGKHNFVDKTFCGNGFTSSFLQIPPKSPLYTNIIVVPNRAVVINKQKSYEADKNYDKLRVGFFYEGSPYQMNFQKYDVMMFVVDSFMMRLEKIVSHLYFIDKIMIDEVHSMYIQSDFRSMLGDFDNRLKESFSTKSVVSVTATPMLFHKIDVRITKDFDEHRTINVSQNQKLSFQRMRDALDRGRKVLLATQSRSIISQFKDKKGVLRANFKVGIKLMQGLVEVCEYVHDEESNLTIISSSGFEGFDLDNGINDVFIYEDRADDWNSFFFQNIIQIIGRSRKGTDYIEYCRVETDAGKAEYNKEEMDKIINSDRISFEKLMTDYNYRFVNKFYDIDVNDGFVNKLKFNDMAYNLYSERVSSDNSGLGIYEEYGLDRGFKLNYLNDGTFRVKFRSSDKKKFEYVSRNRDFISESGIYDSLKVNSLPQENLKAYYKEYRTHLRRKYYESIVPSLDDPLKYCYTDREKVANACLQDKEFILKVCEHLTKMKRKEALEKYGRGTNAYKDSLNDFTEQIFDVVAQMIMVFSQYPVKIMKNDRMWRDYNVLTRTSMDVIEYFAEEFDINYIEFDISKCNPRLIYAQVGLHLPSDFYGENDKNKRKINILLNSLSKAYAIQKGLDINTRKKRVVRDLKKYNFDDKVIDWLMDNFWSKHKDALFNWCAYHEKELLNRIINRILDERELKDVFSIVRRHDSIIVFGNADMEHYEWIVDIFHYTNYMGKSDWFKGEYELKS